MMSLNHIPDSDAFRSALFDLADCMIPRHGTMPGFGESCTLEAVDRSLSLRTDLRDGFARAVLAGSPETAPKERLRVLEKADPEAFNALGTIILCTYYMSYKARMALGYPGQERLPLSNPAATVDRIKEMVAPVVARGERYRAT